MESWKEIATYLQRDVRTAQRWERREGLPVHRHHHEKLASVFAYRHELDAWLLRRGTAGRARRLVPWAGLAAMLLAAFAGAGFWVVRRLPAGRQEMLVRRVWSGPDADRFGAVTPDGRQIVFMDKASQTIALRDLASATTSPLPIRFPRSAESLSQAVSPDGRWIAFERNEGLDQELWLAAIDGSGERLLFRDPSVYAIRVEDWYPHSAAVLVWLRRRDGNFQIASVSAPEGVVRVLLDLGPRRPLRMNLSPDGRWIAFDCSLEGDAVSRDIYLLGVPPGAGTSRPIPLVQHAGEDTLLGWFPDGRTILFASDRSGSIDAWALPVSDGRPAAAPFRVKKDLGMVWPLGFTRDGRFYYGVQIGATDVYTASLDPATGVLLSRAVRRSQRFFGSSGSPDWSADGSLGPVRK